MIKLKPVTVEGLDCLVNSHLTLLQHDFGEYQYAFWDTWIFCYDQSSQYSFGEAINIPMRIYHENIKHYYSADIEKISIEPWGDFKSTALGLLEEDVPIIVSVDTYYCNWYENFRKSHSEHTFIITSYKNDFWDVLDTVPPRAGLKMAEDDLRQGIFGAHKVKFSKRNERKSLMQFLEHTLERKKKKFEQENLEQFVKDFDEVHLEDEIIYNKYVWSVPILRNVRRIYYSRKQFLEYVDYLKTEKDSSLVSFINENFTPIIVNWAVIMNVLYKMQISHRINQKDKIRNILDEVAQKENEFFKKITKVISCPELLADYGTQKNTEFIQLSLEYNGYSHFFETKDFVRKTELEEGKLWVKEGVRFNFPKISNGRYNCMHCKGQTIELPRGKIETIHLIGYATWGNQIASYQIIDEEENIEGELMFSDWCVKPQFAEKVLWKGQFNQKGTKINYVGRIFDVKIPLAGRKTASYLKLPDCEEVVLFAIVSEINA